MSKNDIVVTDELLDIFGEEFQKKENLPNPDMTFIQWVEFRLWELAHKSHAF